MPMCWAMTSCGRNGGSDDAAILSPRSSRPHRKCRSASYGQAVNTIGKAAGCSLPLSARDCGTILLADRLDKRKRQRAFFELDSRSHRSDRTPPPEEPSESPRHFAASMDESVIVGYYTLKKCLSQAPHPSQIFPERSMPHGKK